MNEALKPQLIMRRPNLDGLPDELSLPEGYSERHYQEGDAEAWSEIITESFEEEWGVERFKEYMLGDVSFKPERIRFICNADGKPVGTTSAFRRDDKYGPDCGYVHMVGVLKSEAGKRLGYAVNVAVLHQFKREGCPDAVLQTDDFRLPAIKTYINLGFLPDIVDDNQYQRWRDIYKLLKVDAPEIIMQHD